MFAHERSVKKLNGIFHCIIYYIYIDYKFFFDLFVGIVHIVFWYTTLVIYK